MTLIANKCSHSEHFFFIRSDSILFCWCWQNGSSAANELLMNTKFILGSPADVNLSLLSNCLFKMDFSSSDYHTQVFLSIDSCTLRAAPRAQWHRIGCTAVNTWISLLCLYALTRMVQLKVNANLCCEHSIIADANILSLQTFGCWQ